MHRTNQFDGTSPWRGKVLVTPFLLTIALTTGCASFSEDGGFQKVEKISTERIGTKPVLWTKQDTPVAFEARTQTLLTQVLSAEIAIEIALLNNQTLQSQYAELGIAEADWVRAGRLSNPSFRFGRLNGTGNTEIERAVVFDLLGLLSMPLAKSIEQGRFEQAQLQAIQDTLSLAYRTRRAYVEAVANAQIAHYQEQVLELAEAATALSQQMREQGHLSKLDALKDQAFHAQAQAQTRRAQHQAQTALESLIRELGLSGAAVKLMLPEKLPELPHSVAELPALEQLAMDQRLDLQIARKQTDATARALGLTKATRLINVLDLGYKNKSEAGAATRHGFEIELELPLFDFGSTKTNRAEAIYMQALHQTAAKAIQAQSEVRQAYSAYRSTYDITKIHQGTHLPLTQQISQENLLRYNGMLISVFDLLADARSQIDAVSTAIESTRDFWLAEADLQSAIAGPVSSQTSQPGVQP